MYNRIGTTLLEKVREIRTEIVEEARRLLINPLYIYDGAEVEPLGLGKWL